MQYEIIKNMIKADLANNICPMMQGEPGTGKSSFIIDLAKDLNTKCFILSGASLSGKEDLTGVRPMPTDDTNTKFVQMMFPNIVLQEAIDYANAHPTETPILFLDEINRTKESATNALLSLATERRIVSTPLPNNLKIIAAGNPSSGTTPINKAAVNRFSVYRIDPDVETFLSVNPGLNKSVKAVLRKNPKLLFCESIVVDDTDTDDDNNDDKNGDFLAFDTDNESEDLVVKQFSSPRSITAISNWLNSYEKLFGFDGILELANTPDTDFGNALTAKIYGTVGRTEFANTLIEEISLSQDSEDTEDINLAEPLSYGIAAGQTDRQGLIDYVGSLSNAEQTELLIFCLQDARDNGRIVEALAEKMTAIDPTQMVILSKLNSANSFNEANMEELLKVRNSTIVPMFNIMGHTL